MGGFPLEEDIELVKAILDIDDRTLSNRTGISRMTFSRWMSNPAQATHSKLEMFYSFAFDARIALSQIHAQLFIEESRRRGLIPLFHGSKLGIQGPLSLACSRPDNDFGPGFYCGESYQQAAMFVARHPHGLFYSLALDPAGLAIKEFSVSNEWMLTVAFFRRKLEAFRDHPMVASIARDVEAADCIIAPIADNRMFQIIDSFINGEITDVQCEHSLSATDLGRQFVLRTEAALDAVVGMQPHYLCEPEKTRLLSQQRDQAKIGTDKAKAARRQYRAQGRYIEEMLG